MNVSELAKKKAVRVLAASVGAIVVGVPAAKVIIDDQVAWNHAYAQVDAYECSRALANQPVLMGTGFKINNVSDDRELTCHRADGSEVKVTITQYQSLISDVRHGEVH